MKCKSKLPIGRSGSNSSDPVQRNRRSNGFTLMELLIVIAIILILMLMAIPTIGSLTKKGNETSAINSVQTIIKGGDPVPVELSGEWLRLLSRRAGRRSKFRSAEPKRFADSAGLILLSGYKSGYIFTLPARTR